MEHTSIFFLVGRLRALGNEYIVSRLEAFGLRDIAPSHGNVLAVLFKYDSCKMGQIAKFIVRNKSTVTMIVEKLERYGYVRRSADPDDARGAIVSLTDKGKALRPIFEEISDGLHNFITQKLEASEIETLEHLLNKCLKF